MSSDYLKGKVTVQMQITLHVKWNEDGDAVAYTCEKTAESRLIADYGGTVVGSKVITTTVFIDKPCIIARDDIDETFIHRV